MFSARILSSRACATVLAVIAFGAFMPGVSQALQTSTTYTFDAVTVDGYTNSYMPTFSTNVNQFNPALGTLDSIGVVWSTTLVVDGTAAASGEYIEASAGNSTSFNGEAINGYGAVASATATGAGPFTGSGTEGETITLTSGVSISPANFEAAIGTGTIPVAFLPSGNFAGSPTVTDQSVTSSGSVQITYNYTPAAVPLPSALGMSLLGLGTLGLFGFIKKARNQFSASAR